MVIIVIDFVIDVPCFPIIIQTTAEDVAVAVVIVVVVVVVVSTYFAIIQQYARPSSVCVCVCVLCSYLLLQLQPFRDYANNIRID